MDHRRQVDVRELHGGAGVVVTLHGGNPHASSASHLIVDYTEIPDVVARLQAALDQRHLPKWKVEGE